MVQQANKIEMSSEKYIAYAFINNAFFVISSYQDKKKKKKKEKLCSKKHKVYTKCCQECLYVLMLNTRYFILNISRAFAERMRELQLLRLGEELDMYMKEQWRKWGSVCTCECTIRTLLFTLVQCSHEAMQTRYFTWKVHISNRLVLLVSRHKRMRPLKHQT